MGIFFRRQGMTSLAQRQYDQALAASFISNKLRADITVNLGNLLRDKRNYESAKSDYLAALKLRPGHPAAEYNLAVTEAYLSLNAKNYNQAIDDFVAAIRLDPSDPMLYYNVGLIYDNYMRDSENALKYYNNYLRLAGDGGYIGANVKARIAALTGLQKQ
jgi:tetratricopeptide (TPR) repeat protein